MKPTKLKTLTVLGTSLTAVILCDAANAQQATNQAPMPERLFLKEASAHHRLWVGSNELASSSQQISGATNWPAKHRSARGRRVREMASGMHYWNGAWFPSDPSFIFTNGAFFAEKVQHRVRLASDLSTIGSVTVMAPSGASGGISIQSTPVAIALYDPASGRSVMLATITNCSGTLVSSNRVVYEGAFRQNGLCASVVYSVKSGSFSQDTVITGFFDPVTYGFPVQSRLQVWTELFNVPVPDRTPRPIQIDGTTNILHDELIGFQELVLGPGFAYMSHDGANVSRIAVPIGKE